MESSTLPPDNSILSRLGWQPVHFTYLWLTALFVYVFLLIVPFPLFVIIYIMNREWDQEEHEAKMAITVRTESTQSSIYSIINHLFIAVCFYYLFMLLIVISYLSNFATLLIATLAIFLAAISHAYQIVLSFLAIQRFFIYFFPCLEPHLTPKKPRKLWTNTLLLLLFVWTCILLGSSYFSIGSHAINWKREKISMIYYTVLNGLLFFSASFYIPVVISIRRLQHLGSSIKNAPHKYILYQTIFIISLKTSFAQMCLFDLLFTPTTIQISYFICNKKTLAIVWKKLSNIYRKVFKQNSVEPSVHQVIVPPK